ncbi:MAG TPA: hypothetical protein VFU80_09010, partial [Sphingomicrobium sp.]|nr:hypothetical protein [Sphingomicrobium sp.]
FAEIITGEYLGPAENSYRERAGEIVSQAQLLLAAVEDIDLAARLKSHERLDAAELSDALAHGWEDIERQAQERGVTVAIASADEPARCGVSPQLLQRLVERMCLAVIGSSDEGESLIFRIGSEASGCALSVDMPRKLKATDLRPDRNRRAGDSATLPLRLVTGLARAAGGDLVASRGRLTLRLPKA